MSKKMLEILNHFRKLDNDWKRYDKGISNIKPIDSDEFAKNLSEIYNIKDDE